MQPLNKKIRDYNKLLRLYNAGAIFTAFDTETTSCTPTTGRIIEIGAVKFTKDGIIETYSQLFNPNQIITPFIQNLTHITNEMVAECPPIESKLKEFLDFITGTILIAHNAQFDINFLSSEITKSGLLNPRNKFIDTLQFSRNTYKDFSHHNLAFLAQQLEINPGNAHRAYDDAVTCMNLFLRLLRDSEQK